MMQTKKKELMLQNDHYNISFYSLKNIWNLWQMNRLEIKILFMKLRH
jgi:hypothetical protein